MQRAPLESPMGGRVAVLGAGGFVGARLLEMAVLSGRTDIVPVVRSFRSAGRSAQLAFPRARFTLEGVVESPIL